MKTTFTIGSFLRLVRFDNALFGTLTIFLAGILSSDIAGFVPEYIIAAVSVFFLGMGSFAINDYFDHDIDRANGRTDRPIVKGEVKRESALYAGVFCLLISVLLSLTLNRLFSALLIFNAFVFIAYSYNLKKIFLIKNIIMAYGFFSMILTGTLISDHTLENLVFYYAVMGFIVGLGFEIMMMYVVVMVLDPLPFFVNIAPSLYHDILFLVLIMVPVILYAFISRSLFKDTSKANIGRLRERTINVMQLGSVTYLLGYLL